ncbi:winged helix-turn-helix domain-containing protein [Thalassomonas sp. RHCl1]|uniref:winged helix-turn-helix domain-containing protein n=1 Tax=Thalassomonas sp. RHCl1 TaxID=2995320 RepID=UPI00248B4C96|nr:winged helix-turn-helix domain-containing protein [Thalassomonas sp. RHCl1]
MDKSRLIKLNQWTLDPVNNTLIDPDNNKTTIEAKYIVLLEYLAKNGDALVTRDQLIQDVWQDRHVEYRTVNSAISRLRKILGGERDDFIKTHPKLGYSLNCQVEFLGKPVANKTKKIKSLNKYVVFSLILCFALWSISWLQITPLKQEKTTQPPLLIEKDISVVPLTYMEGWEQAPAISADQTLLAFTHQSNRNTHYQVIVQEQSSKQVLKIEPDNSTGSPFWQPESRVLFYQSFSEKECFIKKVSISSELIASLPEKVVFCGQSSNFNEFTSIAISKDLNWLYYIYRESTLSPSIIKRFHLKSNQIETLTTSSIKFAGDKFLSLSPDDSKLAVMRVHDDYSREIMVLNLLNGELSSIIKPSYSPYPLSWSKFGNHILYTGGDTNTINAVNINTKKHIPLFQHTKQLLDPVMLSETNFLVSFGDLYKSDIKQVDLSKPDLVVSNLINSSFKDHSAAIYENSEREKIAFVSNRSGNYQIWLKEHNKLQQLTQFEGKPYIEDLSFSLNGKNLLFLKDNKLKVLNIDTREVITITQPTKYAKNFTWQCNSNENILVIAKKQGGWGLYRVNIFTQDTKLLTTGLTSIHNFCNNVTNSTANNIGEYYASSITEPGIFQLTNNWEIDKTKHYLTQITFNNNNKLWAVSKSAIYHLDSVNNIYQFNYATQQNKKINIQGVATQSLSIQNNKLILNNLQAANTFIGKITIPDLSKRLTDH